MRTLALAALLAAPAAAARPLALPAPEFPTGTAWLNAEPLTLARLRGRKAMLLVFLSPSDLHSLRLLPALKAWFDRYALSQLMVVGAIAPEFSAQKDPAWIRAEVNRLGLEFPVVIDADRKLWSAYGADGWPELELVDAKGLVVFDHLGEGDYDEIEREIREALEPVAGDLPAPVDLAEPPADDCGRATADVRLGERGKTPPRSLDGEISAGPMLLVASRDGEVAKRGKWASEADGLRLEQRNKDQLAFVRVIYQGAQALAALAPAPGKKQRFFVKLDDQWLYEGIAGKDVRYDDDGRSYVLAEDARLFDLAREPGKPHERMLAVYPEGKGGAVLGFSFADRCLETTLP